MNVLDIVIVVLLLLRCIKGYRNGFIIEVLAVVALVVGIYMAAYFSDTLGIYLQEKVHWNKGYTKWVAFVIIFVGVIILAKLLGKFFTRMAEQVALGSANRIMGALFGTLRRLIIIGVLLVCLLRFHIIEKLYLEQSHVANSIYKIGHLLTKILVI